MEDIKYSFSSKDISYDVNSGRINVKGGLSYRVFIKQGEEEKELKGSFDKKQMQELLDNIRTLFDKSQIQFNTLDNLTIDNTSFHSKDVKPKEVNNELLQKVTKTASLIFLQEISPPKENPEVKKTDTKEKESKLDNGMKITDHEVHFKHEKPKKFSNSKTPRIQNTLGKASVPKGPMKYSQAEISDEDFNNILIKSVNTNTVTASSLFYSYDDENGTYTDFANELFGSAYLDSTAQEEILVLENPDLAFLIEEEKMNGNTIYTARNENPTPVLVENVTRKHECVKPYKKVTDIEQKNPTNIVAMAAQDRSGTKGPYDEASIKYHLKAAYLAFKLAKEKNPQTTIHTGLWGCGVFSNNRKMMLAIQVLAARMAGVKLKFYGIGQPTYSGYKINNALNGKNPEAIIQNLVQLSQNDPTWQT